MFPKDFDEKNTRVGVFDTRAKYNKFRSFSERVVEKFELEFFLDDGGITFINGKEYMLQKNHIILAKPGDVRKGKEHFKCFYLHMQINDESMLEYMKNVPTYFSVANRGLYYNLFHQLIQLRNEKTTEGLLLYFSKLFELIVNVQRDSLFYVKEGETSVVFRAERFMTENFSEKIGLKEIAESVHLSPNYFHKMFTSVTGNTPHEYLMRKRINYAKELIMMSDHDMMEIALMSGFGSQAYFNYCFKKEAGMSPLKYREKEFAKYKI